MKPEDQSLEYLIQTLDTEDEYIEDEIYDFARDTLIARKKEALPLLIATLKKGKYILSDRILDILAYTFDKEAIEPIYQFIISDPENWGWNGGLALAKLGDSRSLTFLLPVLLKIYKSDVYIYAAPTIYAALNNLGDKRVLPALYWFLYQEGNFPLTKNANYATLDGSDLREAIIALEKKEVKQSVQCIQSEPFLRALKESNSLKRREAVIILACILPVYELKLLFSHLLNDEDKIIYSIVEFILYRF